MTLRDMEYFVAIQEEKSITKAAAKLYIAQPALSQCVQKVEKELGFTVFHRTTTGVKPTVEGEIFIQFIRKTLAEQESFRKQIEDLDASGNGTVSLGFSGAQAAFVLPKFLSFFQQTYPSIEIQLVEGTSDAIEFGIENGKIDAGILHAPILSKNLDYFELSRDRMVIIPQSHSSFASFVRHTDNGDYLNINFLKSEPIILTEPWQRSRMICDQIFEKANITPVVKQTAKNIATLNALALVDYATVVLPEKQLSADLENRSYYFEDTYNVPYSFMVCIPPKNAYISKPCQKLLNMLYSIRYTF